MFTGGNEKKELIVVNTFPWEVTQVVVVEEEQQEMEDQEPCKKASRLENKATQSAGIGQCYMAVQAAGIGWTRLGTPLVHPPVKVCK